MEKTIDRHSFISYAVAAGTVAGSSLLASPAVAEEVASNSGTDGDAVSEVL